MNITRRQHGFTLIEISIVASIIGLLAAIAVPNFIRVRTESCQQTCIANLRNIEGAMQQYAAESRVGSQAAVEPADLIPFLRSKPVCPTGGTSFEDSYVFTTVSEAPHCQKMAATHALPADNQPPFVPVQHNPNPRPIYAPE